MKKHHGCTECGDCDNKFEYKLALHPLWRGQRELLDEVSDYIASSADLYFGEGMTEYEAQQKANKLVSEMDTEQLCLLGEKWQDFYDSASEFLDIRARAGLRRGHHFLVVASMSRF